jgi:hypothetical protein
VSGAASPIDVLGDRTRQDLSVISRLVLAVTLLLSAGLTACGDDDDSDDSAATTATLAPVVTALPGSTLPSVTPSTYEGEGDQIIEIATPVPGRPAVAALTSTTSGAFIVDALDADGNAIQNLVDVLDSYEGSVPIDWNPSLAPIAQLQIQAPGPWTIVLSALTEVPQFTTGKLEGDSDDVFVYMGAEADGEMTFAGQGAAVLIGFPSLDGGLPDTLANIQGPSDTPTPFQFPGPSLVQVQAQGPWSIQVNA